MSADRQLGLVCTSAAFSQVAARLALINSYLRMQRVLAFSLISLAAAAYAQTQTTSKPRHSVTSASSTAAKKRTLATHAHTTPTTVKAGTRTRSFTSRARQPRAKPGPSYQLHPDPERYQQIQQALADRGYFKGTVNGEWGDDSVDALKKFQADQKLDIDGKINSLSLIDLGLGPKHDGTSGRDAPVPAAPPPASPEGPVAGPSGEPSSSSTAPR